MNPDLYDKLRDDLLDFPPDDDPRDLERPWPETGPPEHVEDVP